MAPKRTGSVVSSSVSAAPAKKVVPPPPANRGSKTAATEIASRPAGKRKPIPAAGSPAKRKAKAAAAPLTASSSSGNGEWWTGHDGKAGDCLACGAPPGSKAWVHTAQRGSGSNSKQHPVGFVCCDCHSQNSQGWPHLNFEEYADRIKTPEGRTELQEFLQTATGDPDFLTSKVESTVRFDYLMSRSYIALTASDYRRVLGKDPPGARGPKVPVMRLPSEGSTTEEDHYLFLDPGCPHRKLTVQMTVGDALSTCTLAPSDNRFEGMAMQVMSSSAKERQERNKAATALFRPNTALPDIKSHMQKVNADLYAEVYGGDEADATTRTCTIVPNSAEGDPTDAVVTDIQGTFVINTAGSDSKLRRKFASSCLPSATPQKTGAVQRSPSGIASSPPAGAAPEGDMNDIAPADSISMCGGGSEAPDHDAWASSAAWKRMTSRQKLENLKRRINLVKILEGEPLGRQENPVKKYLTNGQLDETDVRLLRNYLKLVVGWGSERCVIPGVNIRWMCDPTAPQTPFGPHYLSAAALVWDCRHTSPDNSAPPKVEATKQLAPPVIMTLSQPELLANLQAVTEAGIALPSTTQSCMVSIAAAEHLLVADHTDDGIRRLVSCSKPWVAKKEELTIDNKDSWKLGNVVGLDEDARIEWFLDTFMTGFIVKHMAAGDSKVRLVKSGCACFVDEWNNDTFSAELGDATASMMEKCLRCCRVLTAIISYDISSLEPELWDDIDWIGKLRNSSSLDIDSVVAVAIQDSDWFGQRFTQLLNYRPVVERLGDQLASDLDFWETVAEFTTDNAAEMTDTVQRLCMYKHDLPPEMFNLVVQLASDKLNTLVKNALEKLSSTSSPSALQALQKLTAEVVVVFSLDSAFDELHSQVAMAIRKDATVSIHSKCAKLLEALAEEEGSTVKDSNALNDIATFVKDNPGFSVNNSQLQLATKAMEKCLEAIVTDFGTDETLCAPLPLMDLCNGFLSNAMSASDSRKAQASMWRFAYDLRQKTSEFANLGNTTDERLENDAGDDSPWPKLTKVRIATQALKNIKTSGINDNPIASNDKVKNTLSAAEKLIAECSHIVVTKNMASMSAAASPRERRHRWQALVGLRAQVRDEHRLAEPLQEDFGHEGHDHLEPKIQRSPEGLRCPQVSCPL